jgi:hypothetical protein
LTKRCTDCGSDAGSWITGDTIRVRSGLLVTGPLW